MKLTLNAWKCQNIQYNGDAICKRILKYEIQFSRLWSHSYTHTYKYIDRTHTSRMNASKTSKLENGNKKTMK